MKILPGLLCLVVAMVGCQQPTKNAEQTPPPPVEKKQAN